MVHLIIEYFDPKLLYLFVNNTFVLVAGIEITAMLTWVRRNGWALKFGAPSMNALKFLSPVVIEYSALNNYNQVLKSEPILCLADSLVCVRLGIHLQHGLVTPNCDSCWK